MKILAKRMRELRKSRNLSQKQAAEEIGIKSDDYKNYELEKANPKIPTLVTIAKFYGVSINFLLGIDEQKIRYFDKECNISFAENLRRIRNEHQLSLEKLANGVGISRRMVSYYEQGKKVPTLKTLIKIANFLEISIDEIVGDIC